MLRLRVQWLARDGELIPASGLLAQLGCFARLAQPGQVEGLVLSVRPVHAVDQTINIIEPAGPQLIFLSCGAITGEDERLAQFGDDRAVERLAGESLPEVLNRGGGFIAQECNSPSQPSQPRASAGCLLEQGDCRVDAPVGEIQLDAQGRRVGIIARQGRQDREDPLLLLGLVEEQVRERQAAVPVVGINE